MVRMQQGPPLECGAEGGGKTTPGDVAAQFVAAIRAGAEALSSLLTEDASFNALNVEIKGREDVIGRLLDEATGRVYRQAEIVDAVTNGDAVQLTLRMPSTAPHPGNVLLLRCRGSVICRIEQQTLLPMRPAPTTPLRLTAEVREAVNGALAGQRPMLFAYVDANDQPVLSFRGSTQVFSDTQLALWVRNAGGGLLAAIERNPKVALMYRDEDRKATFQFQGRAWIATEEEDRRRIFAGAAKVEQDHDFARLGVAVVIDLDKVEGYAGLTSAGQVGRVNMRRA